MKKIFMVAFLSMLSHSALATDLNNNQKINLLNRIGYGVTEESYSNLNKMNYEDWVKNQIYYLKNENYLEDKYKFPINNEDLFILYKNNDFFYNQTYLRKDITIDLSNNTINKSLKKRMYYDLTSENRLREVLTSFWYNHFNVGPYTNTTPAIFLNDYENRIRQLSLGNFKDLLTMVSHHPAMLVFLNNNNNQKPIRKNSSVGLNENYAREFLELHTMGVGSGYTQKDVQELAKILSGFSVLSFEDSEDEEEDLKKINSYQTLVKYSEKNIPGKVIVKDYSIYKDKMHFDGDKIFLGKKIESNGNKEIDQVIDLLIKDKRVAYFISKKLAVYLLSDTPSEEIINKMAEKFYETQGQIDKTVEVLLLSQEYIKSLNNPIKIKDPYNYMLSTMKTGLKGKPWDDENIMNQVSGLLINIEASPYYKNTPEGLSIYGKDWLSSSRMQEYFYYNNLIFRSSVFKDYKINYEFLNKIYKVKLKTPEETILFFTSEQWMKK